MDRITREQVALRANAIGRESRRPGAPTIDADSSPEDLARWLQWCDPNGCHTASLAAVEGFEPYDHDRAWEAVAEMIEG